jgi:hypothetical protein
MSAIRKIARSIFVWSYERGTLQYDIICALILAFIFFVPRSCFVSKKTEKPEAAAQNVQIQHPDSEINASQPQK